MKKIITAPSFWLLLSTNLGLIYYYQRNPAAFPTVAWIYWCQSVIIGIFSFLDLVTSPKTSTTGIPDQGSHQPIPSSSVSPWPFALFFLLHYNAFQFVYMIFLFSTQSPRNVDRHIFLTGILAFAISLLTEFIQKKTSQGRPLAGTGTSFFVAYLRIIPMHLMIMGPVFLGWKASTIFLVLKTMADLGMYILTNLPGSTNKTPGS